ncbi:MAG: bifunctional pyr operon transcriptional regulator/uracil phosphoribosyltransferase PyrR [Gammaproteobacteria bacterium]
MTELNTQQLLKDLSSDLRTYLSEQNISDPVFIGIQTGGVWVAKQLQSLLDNKQKLGVLDITFYRDDFSRAGIQPTVKPSKLPLGVDDKHIVLVDDVLHTGRTVRAALNEIFDYGRPASVSLVVLVQRNGNELPIQADVTACKLNLDTTQHIKLSGPEPLELKILEVTDNTNSE